VTCSNTWSIRAALLTCRPDSADATLQGIVARQSGSQICIDGSGAGYLKSDLPKLSI